MPFYQTSYLPFYHDKLLFPITMTSYYALLPWQATISFFTMTSYYVLLPWQAIMSFYHDKLLYPFYHDKLLCPFTWQATMPFCHKLLCHYTMTSYQTILQCLLINPFCNYNLLDLFKVTIYQSICNDKLPSHCATFNKLSGPFTMINCRAILQWLPISLLLQQTIRPFADISYHVLL